MMEPMELCCDEEDVVAQAVRQAVNQSRRSTSPSPSPMDRKRSSGRPPLQPITNDARVHHHHHRKHGDVAHADKPRRRQAAPPALQRGGHAPPQAHSPPAASPPPRIPQDQGATAATSSSSSPTPPRPTAEHGQALCPACRSGSPSPIGSAEAMELRAQVSYLKARLFQQEQEQHQKQQQQQQQQQKPLHDPTLAALKEQKELLMESLGQKMEEGRDLMSKVESLERDLRRAKAEADDERVKSRKLAAEAAQAAKERGSSQDRALALEAALREAAARHDSVRDLCDRRGSDLAVLQAELSEERQVQNRLMNALRDANDEINALKESGAPPQLPGLPVPTARGGEGEGALRSDMHALQKQVQCGNAEVLSRLDQIASLMGFADRVCDSVTSSATAEGLQCYFSNDHGTRGTCQATGSASRPATARPCQGTDAPRGEQPQNMSGATLTPRELFETQSTVANDLTLDSPFMP